MKHPLSKFAIIPLCIVVLCIFGIFLYRKNVYSDTSDLVITEVLTNPHNTLYNGWNPEDTDEYIEIYNNGTGSLDITGFRITDGDGRDDIYAWNTGTYGTPSDTDVVTGTLVIPAKGYGLILDQNYTSGEQWYDFPPGTVILTVDDDTIGTGSGTGGLAKDDPITIYNAVGNSIATYGTPVATTSATYGSADDDGLDYIPFFLLNSEQNNAAERIPTSITSGVAIYGTTDAANQWQMAEDYNDISPGGNNTTGAEDNSLTITEIASQTIAVGASTPVLAFQYLNTNGNKMMYIRIINIEDMNSSDVTSVKLYNEGSTIIGSYEGTETLLGTFSNTASQEWVLDSLSVTSGTNLLILLQTSGTVSSGEKFRAALPYQSLQAWSNVKNHYPALNREEITIE